MSQSKYREKLKSSSANSNESDKEESNEPYYDEDQLQEEETGEKDQTINQVF